MRPTDLDTASTLDSSSSTKISTTLATQGWNVKERAINFFSPLIRGAELTKRFVTDYWRTILALSLAWGVIITAIGGMYGFSATALPLFIGVTAGFGFGILTGMLTAQILDPENKRNRYNTLWNLFVEGIFQLEAYGTRAVLISVIVAFILWSAPYLPTPVGFLFGVVMGNQLATSIGLYDVPPKDPYISDEQKLQVMEKFLNVRWGFDMKKEMENTTNSSSTNFAPAQNPQNNELTTN